MRIGAAVLTAALVGGCASGGRVVLLQDEDGVTGAVALIRARTEAELGVLTTADTATPLGSFRPGPVEGARYATLVAGLPPPPRSYTLYFEEGTTILTPASFPVLQALRAVVTGASDVQITGHTDTVGATGDNDRLSRDRAVEIRAELVKQGLPVDSARVTGRGERELLVPTADSVSEPRNRRVEVILR